MTFSPSGLLVGLALTAMGTPSFPGDMAPLSIVGETFESSEPEQPLLGKGAVHSCSHPGIDTPFRCIYPSGRTGTCHDRRYLPPYPPYDRIDETCRNYTPLIRWRPASEVVNGAALVANLTSSALPKIIDCDSDWCTFLAPTQSFTTQNGPGRGVARCRARIISDNSLSVPEQCEVQLLTTPAGDLLPALTGFVALSEWGALPDLQLVILSDTPMDSQSIQASLRTALAERPLLLVTDPAKINAPITDMPDIVAVGGPRYSKAIKRWEWIQIVIQQSTTPVIAVKDNIATKNQLILKLTINAWTNPNNTTTPDDWRIPTEEQKNKYITLTKQAISAGIQKLCKTSGWANSNVMSCIRDSTK